MSSGERGNESYMYTYMQTLFFHKREFSCNYYKALDSDSSYFFCHPEFSHVGNIIKISQSDILKIYFIYLAALCLSPGTWDLCCIMQDLSLLFKHSLVMALGSSSCIVWS